LFSYDIRYYFLIQSLINDIITEPRGHVISSAASYSGGPEFKFRPSGGLYWPNVFVVFLSYFMQILVYYQIMLWPLPSTFRTSSFSKRSIIQRPTVWTIDGVYRRTIRPHTTITSIVVLHALKDPPNADTEYFDTKRRRRLYVAGFGQGPVTRLLGHENKRQVSINTRDCDALNPLWKAGSLWRHEDASFHPVCVSVIYNS
jgi:hypothetical protein